MKRMIRMAVMMTALMTPFGAMAQDKVEATLSADVVSRYIWRGQDFGNVAVQPAAGISWKGLSLSAWGSYGLTPSTDTNISTRELDFTLGYTIGGLNLGLTDYFCITDGSDPKYFYFEEGGSHVLEANIGYDFGFASVQWYTNINGTPARYVDSDGKLKAGFASYLEISAPFRLGGLDWEAQVGIVPFDSKGFYADADGFAVTVASLKVEKELDITPTFKLPIFGQLVANPSTQRFYFVLGCSLGI